MERKSALHRLVEDRLGGSLGDLVCEQRAAGVSWNDIVALIEQRTGVDVAKETLRLWFAHRLETTVTVR